jgi:hypothetical protein
VCGSAWLRGCALVLDHALVYGFAVVEDFAMVRGHARVDYLVWGNSEVMP